MPLRANNRRFGLASASRVFSGLDRIAAAGAGILISTVVAVAVPLPELRPDPDISGIPVPDVIAPQTGAPETTAPDTTIPEATAPEAQAPDKAVPETETSDTETDSAESGDTKQEVQRPTDADEGEITTGNGDNSQSVPDASNADQTALPVLRPDRTDDSAQQAQIVMPLLRPADPPPPSEVISSADYYTFRQILALLKEDGMVAAQTLAQTLKDPLAQDVAEWLYVRDSSLHAGPQRIRAFIDAHPHWPDHSHLHKLIEAAYFISPPPPQTVRDYFADNEPQTGLGLAVLAYALLKTGEKQQAADLVRAAWSGHLLSSGSERLILRRFSDVLREEDHLNRLRYLLYRKKIAPAHRAANHVGPYGKSLINAHNAIGARSRRARQTYVRTPEAIKQDPVLVLRQAQILRRADKYVEAAALLISKTSTSQDPVNAHGWWPERSLLIRHMLTAMRPDLAYKLAAQHHVTENRFLADAEFLAGWVALRYLYDADLAYFHFRKLRKSVTQPLSIARAEYWLGRAEDMRADHSSAIIRYANAEKFPYTFYGQLAMAALGRTTLTIEPDKPPTEEEREKFRALDLTKAAILFYELDEARHSRRFLVQNASLQDSPTLALLSAELAEFHGDSGTALRIGKAAFLRDQLLFQAAHTVNGLPEGYDRVSGLEPALIYAVSRQESAFDIAAISHAGARGLMQLMPPTAREVAGELQIEYSLARLTQDPSYNVTLGATYLEGLISRFDGSYVMAIPSYNAGGGRVNRWTRIFGDPRDPLVDPIDWIERMPLSEPRDYVQRVLANLQIYRAMLAGGSHSLDLLADLQRGVKKLP
ncbi:MAG: transglycosylase SLT domain-containing protein [Fimbriimonadaceae bacterium]|nr:transglycosylase SLT domain-containing protein [Alphaproteobacteria bacterium]